MFFDYQIRKHIDRLHRLHMLMGSKFVHIFLKLNRIHSPHAVDHFDIIKVKSTKLVPFDFLKDELNGIKIFKSELDFRKLVGPQRISIFKTLLNSSFNFKVIQIIYGEFRTNPSAKTRSRKIHSQEVFCIERVSEIGNECFFAIVRR